MRETKKKVNGSNGDSKKKERHIVTWSQEEDDILRQQISLHGTENWSIIASKFKDKTTRQCRRRWFTYLNSDFKKGGWSPEEDLILCEAQRIYGNRWTEIAKVVSGRTDNAVKNRFTTLCKKKAKYEALAKDNKNGLINSNNKRIILPNVFKTDETPENVAPAKKMRRSHIPYHTETCNFKDRSHLQYGTQQARPPFAVLAQNIRDVDTVYQPQVGNVKEEVPNDANHSKTQGTFLKKGDPKITALMQQAELLGSLALKVNTDNTEQSLEHAWKVLQDFLNQGKENDLGYRISDLDIQLEDFKDLIEDLKISNDGSQLCWRQPDLYESPASSEYSTGSTLLPYTAADTMEQNQAEVGVLQKDIGTGSIPSKAKHGAGECQEVMVSGTHATQVEIYGSCDEQTNNEISVSASSSTEFSSPHQVTPLFRSLAAGIPSPQFSESERNFLLKTLGVESPCPNPSANPSQPPTCKRALIQSL